VAITAGSSFERLSASHYSIDPGSLEDYREVMKCLDLDGVSPGRIIHLWSLDKRSENGSTERQLESGLFSVVLLCQVIEQTQPSDRQIELVIVSTKTHAVIPGDEVEPAKNNPDEPGEDNSAGVAVGCSTPH
jgi:hypothetical protein